MIERQHPITYAVWSLLLLVAFWGVFEAQWSLVFIALITVTLTLIPILSSRWTGVRLPAGFIAAVTIFITATVFLGEAFDFYERLWWWDLAAHSGSAVGFGMVGTVLVVVLVRGDKLALSPAVGALFAFSFALAIGAIWEIFEYGMDQLFGLNMQKSGLHDTMGDLMVDAAGAAVGATAGYYYLRGWTDGRLSRAVAQLVEAVTRKPPK
ncbi:hypothetical protein [Gymnodinialimonas hymeniacidonis]|uniref:hypothetical protein n=1 Tax=Gymnodinialimonas hymeniacidonis TaxID=3126508 RepID=UPI0034C6D415